MYYREGSYGQRSARDRDRPDDPVQQLPSLGLGRVEVVYGGRDAADDDGVHEDAEDEHEDGEERLVVGLGLVDAGDGPEGLHGPAQAERVVEVVRVVFPLRVGGPGAGAQPLVDRDGPEGAGRGVPEPGDDQDRDGHAADRGGEVQGHLSDEKCAT